jgi:hypothetical protein
VIDCRHPAQKVVVGAEAPGRFPLRAVDLGLLQRGRDRAHDARGHLVLQIEYVLGRTIETVCPEVGRAGRVDQLPGDPHSICRLAHAAFEQIADAELATDLPDIDGTSLVSEGRVAGDHEQRSEARQGGRDLLDDAVGEILLLGIAAQVLERQHDDRGRFGNRRRIGQWLGLDAHAVVALD